MLHLWADSGYKLSIDKSPVYSIIYINKCADGKKYHTIPTVQRAAVWCKAVSVSCGNVFEAKRLCFLPPRFRKPCLFPPFYFKIQYPYRFDPALLIKPISCNLTMLFLIVETLKLVAFASSSPVILGLRFKASRIAFWPSLNTSDSLCFSPTNAHVGLKANGMVTVR